MASFLDIAPSLGHGLVSAQGQAGGYDAIDDRRYWGVGRQEGPAIGGAYACSQRTAGANLQVEVASQVGNYLVQGDTVINQGLYLIAATQAVTLLDLNVAPDATNPRVDQIVLEARDTTHTLDGITRARLFILTGTPTAGAGVVNSAAYNTSRAAVPASTAVLAEVIVGAATATITNANIKDVRTLASGTPLVSALPTNPSDGQEFSYVADAANGVVWRFRYRAASTSAYKWEFMGGCPQLAEVATSEVLTAGAPTELATDGPTLTVPLAGDFWIAGGALATIGSIVNAGGCNNSATLTFWVAGVQWKKELFRASLSSSQNNMMNEARYNGMAANTIVKLRYGSDFGNQCYWEQRWLRVTPVRVG